MNFRLGVTGGIGSGKSTVCRVFKVLGIPVFISDDEAKKLMDNDPVIRKELNSIVNTDIYPEGILDRQKLAGLIFNDDNLLDKVNSLVHPAVLNAFNEWCGKQDSRYVILETALLLKSKLEWNINMTLSVIAPMEERILRVMERSSLTRDQVLERINKQMSENEMISKSDFVINNADNNMIIPEIIRIHNDIINLTGKN